MLLSPLVDVARFCGDFCCRRCCCCCLLYCLLLLLRFFCRTGPVRATSSSRLRGHAGHIPRVIVQGLPRTYARGWCHEVLTLARMDGGTIAAHTVGKPGLCNWAGEIVFKHAKQRNLCFWPNNTRAICAEASATVRNGAGQRPGVRVVEEPAVLHALLRRSTGARALRLVFAAASAVVARRQTHVDPRGQLRWLVRPRRADKRCSRRLWRNLKRGGVAT